MLILGRHHNDRPVYITVPPSTEPTVIEVGLNRTRGTKAFITFEAPPEVFILRGELMDQPEENQDV